VIENGGNDFVRKPFRENEIFNMLEKHLGVCFVRENLSNEQEENIPPLDKNLILDSINLLPKRLNFDFALAVQKIDFNAAMKIVKQIEQFNKPLAGVLSEMINSYQFDTLQKLFEIKES